LSNYQTNGAARNPFTRNAANVLGVFGHAKLTQDGIASTMKGANLQKLEESLVSLQSPKWNQELFGSIDEAGRARGETIFRATCASCHTEPYKHDVAADAPVPAGAEAEFITETGAGKTVSLWKVTTTEYKNVGTDPAFIEDLGARRVNKPELTALFDTFVRLSVAHAVGEAPDSPKVAAVFEMQKADQLAKGVRQADGSILTFAMLSAVTAVMEESTITQMAGGGDREAVRRELEFNRAPAGTVDLTSYRARPLNGIAFTAPYGHNGAWPTLRDVLEAEENRPATFPVRPHSFDPRRVGLDTTPPKPGETVFVFDTSKRGNLRTGHAFGTDLPSADKDALLEYLKSL
jgi:hypothetical protein